MRRPKHKTQVDTFPFLAVLLCAMGSFILLLMMIDRRAKIVSQNKARDAYLARKMLAENERAERDSAAKDKAAKLESEWRAQKDLIHVALKAEEESLGREITGLLAALAKTEDEANSRKSAVNSLASKVSLEDVALRQLQKELASRRHEFDRAKQLSQGHLKLREQMTRDLAMLELALRNVQARQAQQRPVYSLVPYKGKHGSSSKPIYIEVTEATVAVHPGPTTLSEVNWSADALRRVIEERTGPLEKIVPRPGLPPLEHKNNPYLLFLVRPAGISRYYEALGFLNSYHVDFGYELIEPDWVFDFSPDKLDQQPWRNASRTEYEPSNVTRPIPKGMGPRVIGAAGAPPATFGTPGGGAAGSGARGDSNPNQGAVQIPPAPGAIGAASRNGGNFGQGGGAAYGSTGIALPPGSTGMNAGNGGVGSGIGVIGGRPGNAESIPGPPSIGGPIGGPIGAPGGLGANPQVASLPYRGSVPGGTGTGGPGTGVLGMGGSGSGVPGTGIPGTGIPGTGIPGTGIPGTGIPGTGIPGTGIPGTGIPGTGVPGTGLPGTGVPGTGIPGSGVPGTGVPGTGVPGTGTPGTGTSDTGIPGVPNGPNDGPRGLPGVGATTVPGTIPNLTSTGLPGVPSGQPTVGGIPGNAVGGAPGQFPTPTIGAPTAVLANGFPGNATGGYGGPPGAVSLAPGGGSGGPGGLSGTGGPPGPTGFGTPGTPGGAPSGSTDATFGSGLTGGGSGEQNPFAQPGAKSPPNSGGSSAGAGGLASGASGTQGPAGAAPPGTLPTNLSINLNDKQPQPAGPPRFDRADAPIDNPLTFRNLDDPAQKSPTPPSDPNDVRPPGPNTPGLRPRGNGNAGDGGEPGPSVGNSPFLNNSDKSRAGPRLPALGRIIGNRDFVMTVECFDNVVTLSPPGRTFDLTNPDAVEQLAKQMKSLVDRRQQTVRPGEPPYRPIVHFRVQAEGRRTYYSVYPRLAEFGYSMSRENPD